jgi:hypothetical protein
MHGQLAVVQKFAGRIAGTVRRLHRDDLPKTNAISLAEICALANTIQFREGILLPDGLHTFGRGAKRVRSSIHIRYMAKVSLISSFLNGPWTTVFSNTIQSTNTS